MKQWVLFSLFSILSVSLSASENSTPQKVTAQKVKVQITDEGFEPSQIKVKSGSNVTLQVTRVSDATCATSIQIKEKKIKKDLPLNKEVSIDLGTLKTGDIRFACGMDMISGHVIAE